jgi:NADPH2:quinone reductase
VDIELPRPSAIGRDLLVEVRAVSVNPVDYKVRASAAPSAGTAKVIGYDAAGVVVEAGPEASLFQPGDEVFYSGSIIRSGTNAEFHLVDDRIVGHKPRTLGFAEAAALPLTSITAWEALFDRMDIRKPVAGAAPAAAEHFGTINAANLKRAHALLETGKARSKIVLEGFPYWLRSEISVLPH